ncbi:unnamed protein product, partial [Tetraodon nigroviridis]
MTEEVLDGNTSSCSKMAGRTKELADEINDKITDVAEYAKRQSWWKRLVGKGSDSVAAKYPTATQLAIGSLSGWCVGYIFQKVGKVAAMSVGGGLLLLPVAYNTGYIKVDWKRVEKDINKAKEQLNQSSEAAELNTFVKKSKVFVKQNIVLTSGFIGGFLLAMVS